MNHPILEVLSYNLTGICSLNTMNCSTSIHDYRLSSLWFYCKWVSALSKYQKSYQKSYAENYFTWTIWIVNETSSMFVYGIIFSLLNSSLLDNATHGYHSYHNRFSPNCFTQNSFSGTPLGSRRRSRRDRVGDQV